MLSAATRRQFLLHGITGVSSVWLSAHFPAVLSAATHAHQAAKSQSPTKFDFLSLEQAAEIDAIASRIIPTTDTPGAHEAGVVYFIDRALVTFAKSSQKTCLDGLSDLQILVAETFPGTKTFSSATPAQQDQILQSLDEQSAAGSRRSRRFRPAGASFFGIVRALTVMGFLIDPESDRRGNRDGVGWKLIGRDPSHLFQPPFGYYDKDYPGWQPNPSAPDKASS